MRTVVTTSFFNIGFSFGGEERLTSKSAAPTRAADHGGLISRVGVDSTCTSNTYSLIQDLALLRLPG